MRYKDRHVVTIITCFWSKILKNPQARGTISIQAVVKVRATNISFNHLPTRNLVPHLLQSFFGHLLSEWKPDRCTGTGDNVMCDRFSPQSCCPVVALKEILLCSIRTLINIEPNLFDNKRMEWLTAAITCSSNEPSFAPSLNFPVAKGPSQDESIIRSDPCDSDVLSRKHAPNW